MFSFLFITFLFQSMVPHSPDGSDDSAGEKEAVFKGLVVLAGMYLFLVAERVLTLLAERRKERKVKVCTPRGGGGGVGGRVLFEKRTQC